MVLFGVLLVTAFGSEEGNVDARSDPAAAAELLEAAAGNLTHAIDEPVSARSCRPQYPCARSRPSGRPARKGGRRPADLVGTMKAIRSAAPVALVALALAPAGAGATTFGADLSVAPNVNFDCQVTPPVGGFQVPSGADTCTWWTTGRLSDTSQGHVVPYGGGTITQARVRVGPVTGPMQFVVMRSLRHPQNRGNPGCCFPVGASAVFTPAPNGITTIPINVRVRHDTDPATGINNFDHIAISVLAPDVPIPAYYTGDQSLGAPTGGAFYPHYTPGTERTTGMFGVVGFQTLINADIDTSAPGSGTPTGPTDVSGTNPIALGGAVRVRRGKALVPLVCTSPRECAGLLRLQNQAVQDAAAAGRGKRMRTYGKKRFSIKAGQTKTVEVPLTKAGKRLMRKRKPRRVFLNVKLSAGQVVSKRIALRG